MNCRRKRMKHLEVVGAVIQYDGKILCMQRGAGKYDYVSYKYEFPGGKVEAGETHPEALMRELREEMNFDVSITEEDYLTTVNHRYPDFEITMYCYLCHPTSPEFTRKEHVNHVWAEPEEMMDKQAPQTAQKNIITKTCRRYVYTTI